MPTNDVLIGIRIREIDNMDENARAKELLRLWKAADVKGGKYVFAASSWDNKKIFEQKTDLWIGTQIGTIDNMEEDDRGRELMAIWKKANNEEKKALVAKRREGVWVLGEEEEGCQWSSMAIAVVGVA